MNLPRYFTLPPALLVCLITLLPSAVGIKSKYVLKINDDNWRDILQGEWMINFYSKAAWCPACKEIERPWNAFADWSSTLKKKKKINVAQVDVSENPGVSGRFLVTALPTVYHVKDGVFRMYNGPKDKEDFIKFVKQKQWSTVERIPSWCHPDSTQMSIVSALFKFSMRARDFHNDMVENKGLPSVASFGIFGLATLVLGCILGFFMVMIIDRFVPSGKKGDKKKQTTGPSGQQSKKDKKNGAGANNNGTASKNHQSQNENGQVKNGSTGKNGNAPNENNKKQMDTKSEPKKENHTTAATNGTNAAKSDKKKD